MCRIVYSRHYNIGFYGLERLHPFDSKKYGRAWKCLRRHFGRNMRHRHLWPQHPVSREDLLLIHSSEYLKKLQDVQYVSRALEVPVVSRLPSWAVDWHVLRPMRWATQGTMLAAEASQNCGLAVNLGGGFHHAKPERGEGFSIYSDIGIAVTSLRKRNLISATDRIVYIDTDAHQGNGVCHTFMHDDRVFIFDIFNGHIYPMFDVAARRRVDCEVALTAAVSDSEYMGQLQERLPGFLDSVGNSPIGIAIYNAGTDVVVGDPLGDLQISAATIRERDLFVVGELRRRRIPTVMVLSGGYTQQSYQLVADSVISLMEMYVDSLG